MPLRFLRPGITNSKRWNSVDWLAQSTYIRLLTVVDDHGRYYADPDILKGHLFAKRQDIDLTTIASICQQLSASQLVVFYEANGEKYLQITGWQERVRSKSKFPEPVCEQLRADVSNCEQLLSIVDNCSPGATLMPTPSSSSSTSPATSPPPSSSPCEQAAEQNAVIPTVDDIIKLGSLESVPEDECRKFWDYYQANNYWFNRYGKLVDVRLKLRQWGVRARDMSKRPVAQGGAQLIVMQKELDRIEKRMAEIKQQYSGLQTWDAVDKADFRKLKDRKAVLLKELGMEI